MQLEVNYRIATFSKKARVFIGIIMRNRDTISNVAGKLQRSFLMILRTEDKLMKRVMLRHTNRNLDHKGKG
jgi:hypothetical protein